VRRQVGTPIPLPANKLHQLFLHVALVALTADVEANKFLIDKLMREMTMFAGALSQLRKPENDFERDLEAETDKRAA